MIIKDNILSLLLYENFSKVGKANRSISPYICNMKNIKESTHEDYLRRLNLVINYIQQNLGKKIDLKILANISNFSEFHFHRIFKAYMGETLASYIIRNRMEIAANKLRNTNDHIEDIAYSVGYEVPSSLSKSFKQLYGVSPSHYRNNKQFFIMKQSQATSDMKLKEPKIIDIDTKTVIYINLRGSYKELDFAGTFSKLWTFVKDHKLFTAGIEHLGVYYNDPKVTHADKLQTQVCLVIHKPVYPMGEVGVKQIEGGKYAVFSYEGSYSNLELVYDAIFANWLPSSNCELREIPIFEKYCNDPTQTQTEKLRTEIYVPIK